METIDNTLKTSKWLRFIFRHIKFQQLMYRIWEVRSQSGLYHIRIDGPQSIFQKSSRYGMQLALFLPTLKYCFLENGMQQLLFYGEKAK